MFGPGGNRQLAVSPGLQHLFVCFYVLGLKLCYNNSELQIVAITGQQSRNSGYNARSEYSVLREHPVRTVIATRIIELHAVVSCANLLSGGHRMIQYRQILRLHSEGISQRNIAQSFGKWGAALSGFPERPPSSPIQHPDSQRPAVGLAGPGQ